MYPRDTESRSPWPWIALLVGAALFTALVAWQGVATVVRLLQDAGPLLLLVIPLFLIPLAAATLSWWTLLRGVELQGDEGVEPTPGRLLWSSWVGLAMNWLLPVAQVGGEVARAGHLTRWGTPLPLATASVVVDKTLQVAAIVLTSLLGAVLLMLLRAESGVLVGAVAGALLFGTAGYGFYRVQRRGLFRTLSSVVNRVARSTERVSGVSESAIRADAVVRELYGERRRIAAAFGWRVVFRLGMAAEIWLALTLIGHRPTVLEALTLEFLGQAVRAAGFLIPAGVGIQEGGFVALTAALGYPPASGLALSLARRVRELGVGLPALVSWQIVEGRRLGPGGREDP